MASMSAGVAAEIKLMGAAVAAVVPPKTATNLLVASWNIRALGGLTASWDASPEASPKRDWRAVALIAELISHFDVVAIQEVRRDTAALRFLLEQLGRSWRFITSDVTEGDEGAMVSGSGSCSTPPGSSHPGWSRDRGACLGGEPGEAVRPDAVCGELLPWWR
ncbi:exonuclease/endonuclease/phosphatase family protein [Tessaracoccus antarcticus]|uniref:endonuclease/exonuclease/phosphatase family protein n=1 Tax=Tessaracoccus antarcticus TaxID=2479848 RepID=UPI0018F6266B|nr:endonuclease/exonuclease/phosphatase family protein [Tessaracoccus antarcticus]